MRALATNAAGIERERTIDCSCSRSACASTSSAFGRPIGIAVSPVRKIPKSKAIHMPVINGTVSSTKYIERANHGLHDFVFEQLVKPLMPLESVLDIGCGSGAWLHRLQEHGVSR